MTKDDIIRMARQCGFWLDGANQSMPMWVIKQEELERFATLVAEHAKAEERKRIIASNAPEIEKINAHIKALEVAVLEEREACSEVCAELYIDGENDTGLAAEMIRARGKHD